MCSGNREGKEDTTKNSTCQWKSPGYFQCFFSSINQEESSNTTTIGFPWRKAFSWCSQILKGFSKLPREDLIAQGFFSQINRCPKHFFFHYSISLMPAAPYMPMMWGNAVTAIYRRKMGQEKLWAKVSFQASDGGGPQIIVSKILSYWTTIKPLSFSGDNLLPLALWKLK